MDENPDSCVSGEGDGDIAGVDSRILEVATLVAEASWFVDHSFALTYR